MEWLARSNSFDGFRFLNSWVCGTLYVHVDTWIVSLSTSPAPASSGDGKGKGKTAGKRENSVAIKAEAGLAWPIPRRVESDVNGAATGWGSALV